jgi:transposase
MANRRFEMHQFRQVLVRMRLGDSDRQISKAGLIGRKKARDLRVIADDMGWLNPSVDLPPDDVLARRLNEGDVKSQPTSLVLPFNDQVVAWHEQGIQGTTIHDALKRKHDFEGSYSSVRRFLQTIKEEGSPDLTVMLDFEPGEAVQIDFGSGPKVYDPFAGKIISTWVFVMTLAWSRHQYAEIVRNQKVDTWLSCHRRGFEWFAGVPKKAIIDNPKCAITKACYYDPDVQRSYAELAEGYGFLISPCPVRDPKKKGRVESGVKYVKRSFLPLREFRDIHDANDQLRQWVRETAGNRDHGTTKQKPLSMFAQTERYVLQSLPDVAPEIVVWSKAKLHGNCHVQCEKCYYSAPFRLVRQTLWLRTTASTVQIHHDHVMVAIHPRLTRPGDRSTVQEHLPPDAVAFFMQDPQWCLKQADAIGPACKELIELLFSSRVLDNLRGAQGIVGLSERFGAVRLEAACRRALRFNNPRYRSVKEILTKGLDQEPEPPASEPLAEAYRGKGRFTRDTSKLLN